MAKTHAECNDGAACALDAQGAGTGADPRKRMSWRAIVVLLVVILVYIIIGGVAFHFIEFSGQEKLRKKIIAQEAAFVAMYNVTAEEVDVFVRAIISSYRQGVNPVNNTMLLTNWDIPSSIFFATTVVSTIGYGYIVPATKGGQAFCAIYALIGIPINLLVMAAIGEKLAVKVCQSVNKNPKLNKNPNACIIVRLLIGVFVGFVCMVFIPAGIFVAMEDWDYATSLYYCIITLTTVGFGDYEAGANYTGELRAFYRLSLIIWVFVGLAWIGWLISDAQEFGHTILAKAKCCRRGSAVDQDPSDENKNDKGKNGKTNEVMMSPKDP